MIRTNKKSIVITALQNLRSAYANDHELNSEIKNVLVATFDNLVSAVYLCKDDEINELLNTSSMFSEKDKNNPEFIKGMNAYIEVIEDCVTNKRDADTCVEHLIGTHTAITKQIFMLCDSLSSWILLPVEVLKQNILLEYIQAIYGQDITKRCISSFVMQSYNGQKDNEMLQTVVEPINALLDKLKSGKLKKEQIPYLSDDATLECLEKCSTTIDVFLRNGSDSLTEDQKQLLSELQGFSREVLDHQGCHGNIILRIAALETATEALKKETDKVRMVALYEYIIHQYNELDKVTEKEKARLNDGAFKDGITRQYHERIIDKADNAVEKFQQAKVLSRILDNSNILSNHTGKIVFYACKQLKKQGKLASAASIDISQITENIHDGEIKANVTNIMRKIQEKAGMVQPNKSITTTTVTDVLYAIIYAIQCIFIKSDIDKVTSFTSFLVQQEPTGHVR